MNEFVLIEVILRPNKTSLNIHKRCVSKTKSHTFIVFLIGEI